jgi:hypothetical protein
MNFYPLFLHPPLPLPPATTTHTRTQKLTRTDKARPAQQACLPKLHSKYFTVTDKPCSGRAGQRNVTRTTRDKRTQHYSLA